MKQNSTIEQKKSEVTEVTSDSQHLGFWQLWNINFGCFGIQFGWTLQMTNTSAIYEYLGANLEQIPLLWLAAPVSGLIVQPIIGYLSDRTWTPWGRRRPYFLLGAIISSLALILMPNASSLWMAAGLLWILDTTINVSMQPFRAFVVDLLPETQITEGFAMQSFFIGLSSVLAAIAPWTISHFLNGSLNHNANIPLTVKLSYYFGAAIFLFTVVWTVVTTTEKEEITGENRPKKIPASKNMMARIWELSKNLPNTMIQLAIVQFFTWLGVFCIFLYLPAAIAHNIFGASKSNWELYTAGIEWAGFCIATYNIACFLVSGALPKLGKVIGRKITHAVCLLLGGGAIASMLFIHNPYLVLLPMVGFGIAWASILSIPYAIVSDSIPKQNMGLYMGIFNIFVVIPQIIVALGLGWLMANFLNNNSLLPVVLGGLFLVIAATLVVIVEDPVNQ
ncbi:MAG: MFS transporter [Pleurocapsa sp.]